MNNGIKTAVKATARFVMELSIVLSLTLVAIILVIWFTEQGRREAVARKNAEKAAAGVLLASPRTININP